MKSDTAQIIDFAKAAKAAARRFESLGHGLYKREGKFYERPMIPGKDGKSRRTFRALHSTTERHARIEMGKNKSDAALAKIGRAVNPYSKSHIATVDSICDFYIKHGCPRKNGREREGESLRAEKANITKLLQFFSGKMANLVALDDCAPYHKWRMGGMKAGCEGHRQVDKELVTLSNVFRFARRNSRATGISENPVATDRIRFCQPDAVRHCRDLQPEDGDELHALARYLFQTPASEVMGWQLLFEAMIGHRSHEIVRLRFNAKKPYEPGFIQKQKGKSKPLPRQVEIGKASLLYLFDSVSSKGTYPFVMIHSALEECLKAHAKWKAKRFPQSPWYFPSPQDPKHPVASTSLTHALRRAALAIGQPHRTSHGLRSYFVNVLRSHAVPDYEIALMIGQTTGGKLIPDVYGKIPAHKMTWLPSKKSKLGPAWESCAGV